MDCKICWPCSDKENPEALTYYTVDELEFHTNAANAHASDKCQSCRVMLYQGLQDVQPMSTDLVNVTRDKNSLAVNLETGGFRSWVDVECISISQKCANILRECAEIGGDDNTGSDAGFKLASFWLDECLTNHPYCTNAQSSAVAQELPTRLIDVGPPGGSREPFLREGPEYGSRSEFLALSHSWGSTPTLTTTLGTLEDRRREIPVSTLPKTFQEAVFITRKFNCQYLWIDSLCIIQDSTADWEKESGRMSIIYRCALMTISAARSTSSSSGCFTGRNGILTRPIETRDHEWLNSTVMNSFPRAPLITPLYLRAWVLQEQALARRVIVYDIDQIRWRCVTATASERKPEMEPLSFERFGHWASSETQIDALQRLIHQPLSDDIRLKFAADNWHQVVKNYTSRGLTYSTDKIVAVAGIVSALQDSIEDTCHAGLWRKWLWQGLTWRYTGRNLPGSRHRMSIAPSWSWASVTGRVEFGVLMREAEESLVEIVDVETSGSISQKSGKLTLRGHLRRARTTSTDKRKISQWWGDTDPIALENGGTFFPDEPTPQGTDIWHIAVAKSFCGREGFTQFFAVAIVPTGGNEEEYRRIGAVTYSSGEEVPQPLKRATITIV